MLNEMGYDIKSVTIGRSNAYYCNHDKWEISDVKILIDSIQAARFVSKNKTQELIKKLVKLCNDEEEYILKTNLVCFNTIKALNDEVGTNVEIIENALVDKKKLSFVYFDINCKKEKEYRKKGSRYIVNPLTLVYYEDFYYLVTWNEKYNNVTSYRLDRMSELMIEKEKISATAKEYLISKKAEKYTKQAFKMFGNKELTEFDIIFDKSILGAVFDKFGYGIDVEKLENDKYKTRVEVFKSPTWEGWVYQFGDKIEVKEQIKKDL